MGIRTVTVVDTLKPVIALKYRENIITPKASEAGSGSGDSFVVSRDSGSLDDTSLMAVVAPQRITGFGDAEIAYAMATLVTALALLGYASSRLRRRSAPVVDV